MLVKGIWEGKLPTVDLYSPSPKKEEEKSKGIRRGIQWRNYWGIRSLNKWGYDEEDEEDEDDSNNVIDDYHAELFI